MRKLNWILPVVAALLLLSSFAHGLLGWPSIRPGLEQAGVDQELIAAIAVGWYFGSVAMALLGAILFVAWGEERSGKPRGRTIVACIAFAYVAFGLTAFLATSFNIHFIVAFVLPGVILGIPVVAGRVRS